MLLAVIRYLLFSSTLLCLLVGSSFAAVVFEQPDKRPQQAPAVKPAVPAAPVAPTAPPVPATPSAPATPTTPIMPSAPDARDVQPVVANQTIQPAVMWRIEAGESLEQAFRRWARVSNWQLSWEAPDLVAQASVELTGEFEVTVGKTVEALNRSGNSLQARFYAANRVLRIVERK